MEGKRRCEWSYFGNDKLYLRYHDTEWGVPLHDDRKLFEFLILEGAQAGLNWITILRKRENYRNSFDKFDPVKVANYDQRKISELMEDSGIVRNRLKLNSAVANANSFLKIIDEFGTFNDYLWGFVPNREPIKNHHESIHEIPSKTAESERLSRDLLKRGFKFVGSTICYAHMQATGMVNDHITKCFRYSEV